MQFVNEETLECFACKYIAKTKTNFRNHLYTMRHHNNVKKMQQEQEEQQEKKEQEVDSDVESVMGEPEPEPELELEPEPQPAPRISRSRKVKAHSRLSASPLFCDDDAFSTTMANVDGKGAVHMENVMWGFAVCMMMIGSFMIGGALAKMQC